MPPIVNSLIEAKRSARAPIPARAQTSSTEHHDLANEISALRPYLQRVARQRIRDRELVDDLVQDTLLAALQGAAAFEGKASLRTWLTGILLRRIADHVRQHHRRVVPLANKLADEAEDRNGSGQYQPDPAEAIEWLSPQRHLEGRQFLQALVDGLTAMPALAAQVFALREIDGLSNDEVARQLGLSPGNSALMLHRARLRLRSQLAAREHLSVVV